MERMYVNYPKVSGTEETLSESRPQAHPPITLDTLIRLSPYHQAARHSGRAVLLPLL